ncbi:MAG: penicillin-binding protein 2 [Desulfovibrio sp.]|jgi:penicillin-binding protein 2|nr:penicillin-binding protein 2 [Desulfovibrio sp.]
MRIQFEPEGFQPPRAGLILLQCIVAGLFFLFVVRFWYLQIHRGEEFARLARENRLRQERIYASRGLLRDRDGRLLAENRPAFGLALVREDCRDIPSTLAQVSEWTGIPLDQLTAKFNQDRQRVKPFEHLLLISDMPFDLLARIENRVLQWPGLEIVTRSKRNYPQGELMAHILGYVAEANEKELEDDKDLNLGDFVGKQGLELVLERRLRGQKGLHQLEVDVLGRQLNKKLVQEPQSGENIDLAIDLGLQQVAWDALEDETGCVVAMDPDTGKLLALVTKPSFDNNAFAAGLSLKEWTALRDNPRHPLQNRVIQSVYPPGSVWKLMMAGMLLNEGVNPTDSVWCTGEVALGKQVFRCWKKGGHGRVDMLRSLIESCDVYYYQMSDRFGIDKIEAFAKACGFGAPTGIDLPHEKSGLVPSKQWKRRRFGEPWHRGETLNVSIGQGFTLVTPVQVASFVSALMNGGKLLKPSLLADEDPVVRSSLPFTAAGRKMILDGMRQTVNDDRGTAKVLRRSDAVMGGKTGTAQVTKLKMVGEERVRTENLAYEHRDHAWIATWGEKAGKRLVVVVMLEHGGHGGSDAGPVARRVYDKFFGTPPGAAPVVPAGQTAPAGPAVPGVAVPVLPGQPGQPGQLVPQVQPAPASRPAVPVPQPSQPSQPGQPSQPSQPGPQDAQDQLDRQDEGLRIVPTGRSARPAGRDRRLTGPGGAVEAPEVEDAREGQHRYDPDTFDPDADTPDGRGGDDGVVPPLRRFQNVAPEDGQ